MFDKELFFKLKWLIAKSELKNPQTAGSFSFQKPRSNSIIDLHSRVSGLHLGFHASRAKHILEWINSVELDIIKIDQMPVENNFDDFPDIGLRWSEYEMTAMADTVHCVYEFLYKHKDRNPVIFNGEFWYYGKIINSKINRPDQIKKDSVLIISYPFMEQLSVREDMNQILNRCTELGVPVLLDCIWLPLTSQTYKLQNTDCIEIVTHSVTKMLPLAGVKGGFCFYKKPLPIEMRHNEIHGKVGAYFLKQMIEQKGYWYVRDSHKHLQEKWCSILDLEKHNIVNAGIFNEGHPLAEFGAKQMNTMNLFSLNPFFNHDAVCTRFLQDKGVI
jgi:hypothetical protein